MSHSLRLEMWVNLFLQDVYLYKGLYKECLINICFNEDILKKNIHLITSYFWLKQYPAMMEIACEVMQHYNQLKNSPGSSPLPSSSEMDQPTFSYNKHSRNLHFLLLERNNIIKYVIKLLIIALKKNCLEAGIDSYLRDGHMLVLLQLDWPNEKHIFKEIIERIKSSGRFRYTLFMKYIINIEILELFMYLSSEQGGSVALDIMIPTSNQLINQRRMSTRGVDKGAKEDFKMAMRRQTARWSENVRQLVTRFVATEKESLALSLVTVPGSTK